jgi:hypothetical protein
MYSIYFIKMTVQSETILPHSLRGVGLYDPYGPEATFRLPHSSNVVSHEVSENTES